QKEKVMVLAVGGRHLVVGASPAGLNTLHVLDESFDPGELTQDGAAGGFADRLRSAMSGRSGA
ncbi:MAG: flagellar biosynthetic protein FliO, partial [Pseudomonadota bacterium]